MIGEEEESGRNWKKIGFFLLAILSFASIVYAVVNLSISSVFHVTAPAQPASLVWTQNVPADVGNIQQGSSLQVPFAFKNSGGQSLSISCAITGAGSQYIVFNSSCPSSLSPQQEFVGDLNISIPSGTSAGDYAFSLSVN